jgi:polyisoprenoid-binding protein YceI
VRRVLIGVAVLLVLGLGGALTAFLLIGGDAPPPPALSKPEASATATATPAAGIPTWQVVEGAPTFVGYRVREEFASFGVKDAVGRTGQVTGTVRLDGDRVRDADLEADMTSLRSDEERRDQALQGRGIETGRYPTARFRLEGPVPISRAPVKASGRLTLHGRTQPVTATVRGQRLDGQIELAGSAPIEFARFAIDAPSVAGFVTVQDHGVLEFKLRLLPSTSA